MRKLLAILLIPIFLFATQGVAGTALYCKGELTKQGIFIKACCDDVDKDGCCNTKSKIVKIEDSFLTSNTSFDLHKILDIHLTSFQVSFIPETIKITNLKVNMANAPPLIYSALYILFRSLII